MKRWQLKEKNDAKTFNGRVNTGSGNRWYAPGDVRSATYLVDSKTTIKQSYSVSKATWDKLYEEALFSKRIPLLSLDIDGLELIVMAKDDFEKIKDD